MRYLFSNYLRPFSSIQTKPWLVNRYRLIGNLTRLPRLAQLFLNNNLSNWMSNKMLALLAPLAALPPEAVSYLW